MKITSVEFTTSAVRRSQYPTDKKPEFLLVGRSNVGKSSFINTLVNRKNLARTSNTPGKTRQINFYNIDFFLTLTLPLTLDILFLSTLTNSKADNSSSFNPPLFSITKS